MRTLFISLALLAVSMVAKAQNVESIFEQFRNQFKCFCRLKISFLIKKVKPGYKKKIKWAVDEKRRKAKRAESRARGRVERKAKRQTF